MPQLIDLTGQRFGRLTVTGRAANAKNGRSRWICICDCPGATVRSVYGQSLHRGDSRSCGCLHRELLALIRDIAIVGYETPAILNFPAARLKYQQFIDCVFELGALELIAAKTREGTEK